jgi:sortase A
MAAAMTLPTSATDYNFGTGGDTLGNFGGATSYEGLVTSDPLSENIRRNKDSAYSALPYGVFSGEIPTEPSSPYHNNLQSGGFTSAGQNIPATGGESYAHGNSTVSAKLPDSLLPSTSQTAEQNTEPWYYEDGSIGTLKIQKLNNTIKVLEGESLENLRKGSAHFFSGFRLERQRGFGWNNRGSWAYFDFVKYLNTGDKITYTTRYGTRNYEVCSKIKISVNDTPTLGWTDENMLTLITCIANVPATDFSLRTAVFAWRICAMPPTARATQSGRQKQKIFP